MARRRQRATFECPNCGADVPVGAPACRECGSDERTGWSDDTLYDDLDLPETYAELEAAFRPRPRARRLALGALLILLLVILFLVAR